MDPISETLVGLDALAKLVVCTIGLFCVPTLTRKYAQNLGIPAGQAIMSKAFLASQFMGMAKLPSLAKSSLQSGAVSIGSKAKQGVLQVGKSALVGGEKVGRSFAARVSGSAGSKPSSKLETFFEDQSIKKALMKENGVSPWTKTNERKLKNAKNPKDIRDLSHQRKAAQDFEKAWSQMKEGSASSPSMVRTNSIRSRSEPSKARNQTTPISRNGASYNQASSGSIRSESVQSGSSNSFVHSQNNQSHQSLIERHQTLGSDNSSRPNPNSQGAKTFHGNRGPKTRDLYERYQQLLKQKRSWK